MLQITLPSRLTQRNYARRIRNQLRRFQQQKETVKSMKTELLRLESTIGQMRGLASLCRELLIDVNTYIDMGNRSEKTQLDNDLQSEAKKSAHKLMRSVSKIAEWPITKGV